MAEAERSLRTSIGHLSVTSVVQRARAALGILIGALIVGGSTWFPTMHASGWQPIGPLLGVTLVVCSLFGDLPPSVAWLQRLGAWLFPGIALGVTLLLLPLLFPHAGAPSSVVAFSPTVWAAYISIVFVGISFESSGLPHRLYELCVALPIGPIVVIPLYIVVMGLLGNVLDGVSIMAISVVIFLRLLPTLWALRASFALLFGGLIANLVTVAAEPTNIKFQDVLQPVLDKVRPAYWFTNWPISVLGILAPALWLAWRMWRDGVAWRRRAPDTADAFESSSTRVALDLALSATAIALLAAGIIAHSALSARSLASGVSFAAPLWVFLAPAGVVALLHLSAMRAGGALMAHLREQAPVWGALMVIFSLLWFLSNAISGASTIFSVFFLWPEQIRYGLMIVLSLASSITDNVALAAMQGALLIHHPIATWQIRLLFILLTWSGGFTPFGCLQSLTTNSRLKLSMGAWLRETVPWATATILGGLIGLALITWLYPHAVGLPR